MKVTAVYIDLDSASFAAAVRSRYQFLSNYLTLSISGWVKSLKLDLGPFNRIIFEEGSVDDLSVSGDRAFVVCLVEEFVSLEKLSGEKLVHEYFVKKYMEGFERFGNPPIFSTRQK